MQFGFPVNVITRSWVGMISDPIFQLITTKVNVTTAGTPVVTVVPLTGASKTNEKVVVRVDGTLTADSTPNQFGYASNIPSENNLQFLIS